MGKTVKEVFEGALSQRSLRNFGNYECVRCRIDKQKRALYCDFKGEKYANFNDVCIAEQDIKQNLRLNLCDVTVIYDNIPFSAEYCPDMIARLKRRSSKLNGFFDGADFTYENGVLNVDLKNGGLDIIKSLKTDEKIKKYIAYCFGISAEVKFSGTTHATAEMTEENAREAKAIIDKENEIKQEQQKQETLKKLGIKEFITTKLPEFALNENLKYNPESAKPLLGALIQNEPTEIGKLSLNSGLATICGDIFYSESRQTKSGKFFEKAYITDYTGAFTLKMFLKEEDFNNIGKLDGKTVIVSGKVDYDDYEHETVLSVRNITKVDKITETDESEEKRVELHMHTNMSQFDAMTPAEDLIMTAYKWGHKAVAITDHGVVQSFPAAMNTVEAIRKKGGEFKILYGCEAYFVNDFVKAVSGEKDEPFDGEFIAFDLETTGLNFTNDRITEFGAVRIKNGEVVDKFGTLVNPQMPISAKITELTGITDEMVKDAPLEAEALKQFLDFAGDAPLIAHNANFDVSFVRAAAKRQGIDFNPTYIDTVPMARALLTSIKNYKLDTVAKALHLPEFNHHRAYDDANICGLIFVGLAKILSSNDENANSIQSINSALAGSNPKKQKSYHMILLVKNLTGLKNLYKLVSKAHLEYFYRNPRIPRSELDKHREGLIIGSACEQGELYRAIVEGKPWGDLLNIASYYDYLEVQPNGNNEFMVRSGMCTEEDLCSNVRTIIKIGQKLNKPVVATGDVHFLKPSDAQFRAIIMHGKGFSDADNQAPLYLKTTTEMMEDFSYLGEKLAHEVVIDNPNKIADMIEDIRPIPEGNYPPSIPGSDESLTNDCYKTAKEVYGDPLPEIVQKRLDKELGSIIKNGFSIMYVAAQKVVEDSNDHGYLVGSRGSVGSSFVATRAGISEVNPLAPHYICKKCKYCEFYTKGEYGSGFDLPPKKCPNCGEELDRDGHDIPFETFLGFKGDKVPDIDLNFSGEYQNAAQKYTETLFGKDNVFKAGTISTVASKSAFGYVKKYAAEHNMTLNKAQTEYLTQGCTGIKSTTGQHPAGMIVVPRDKTIYDFCPVQHPANDQNSDIITTHFDFHSIHDTILKLDMLGHDVPTIYHYLELYTGIPVMSVPMSDEKVMSLFTSPKALGVTEEQIKSKTGTFTLPELGTPFVREMLIETQPKTFADLLQISGLSHGTDVWLGNAQELIKSGQCDISNVIGTRDNIMMYLIHKGMEEGRAFKITETVRKGLIAKGKVSEEDWNAMADDMRAVDVPEWYIESCRKIKYMFPKAHAAAYMISALRLGWYKVYRPVEYYAAYFTVRSEGMDAALVTKPIPDIEAAMREIEAKGKDASANDNVKHTILQIVVEMKCRGLEFLPVDFYKSKANMYSVEDGKIRLPFSSINGVGENAAVSLEEAAKIGGFLSQDEIIQNTGVTKSVVDALTEIGALKLPKSNQISFF